MEGASAWLATSDDGVLMALQTTGLDPESAYTVWWVVFNRPEACTTHRSGPVRCGEKDLLERPETEASALFAAGNVVAGGGAASFGAYLAKGDTAGCQQELPCGEGLTNPGGAEIHLVVRSHGPTHPDVVEEQTTTFNGGCRPGEPNEGQCRNIQAAAFGTH